MSGFETRWLDLREPVDHRARHTGLRGLALDLLDTAEDDKYIVDVGCGTGSTFRALMPEVAGRRWRFVDHDPRLLEEASKRHRQHDGGAAEFLQLDLADVRPDMFSGAALVTASALFDLASLALVESLAGHLKACGASLYAALNYNGVCVWSSRHDADDLVVAAFNEHQRGDKGLGPALGPDSGPILNRVFEKYGFDVMMGESPWRFGSDDAELHAQFIDGMATAVGQTRSLDPLLLQDWRRNRLARVHGSTCEVGHWDVLAIAPQERETNKTDGQPNDGPAGGARSAV